MYRSAEPQHKCDWETGTIITDKKIIADLTISNSLKSTHFTMIMCFNVAQGQVNKG